MIAYFWKLSNLFLLKFEAGEFVGEFKVKVLKVGVFGVRSIFLEPLSSNDMFGSL